MGIDSTDPNGTADGPERRQAEDPNDDQLGGGAGSERDLEGATDPKAPDDDDLAEKLDVDPESGDIKG